MGEPTASPWRTLGSRVIYDNPWITVREDQVLRPDGQPGIYGVVHMKTWAVGVVARTDDAATLLVGQYRYTLDAYSWEIPEGGGATCQTLLASAQRELMEETGVSASRWSYLGEVHTSNSVTDESGVIFVAEGLAFGRPTPEGTERIEVRRLPLAEAVDLADSGEISDSLSVIGLLRAERWLQAGRRTRYARRSFAELGLASPDA
jgi:8-oxo-dGTP pyrophosphatase MutT (NUDIX family)